MGYLKSFEEKVNIFQTQITPMKSFDNP